MLPKLVASIPASTQAKVFATLVACLHPLGHVLKQTLKRLCPRRFFEAMRFKVAKIEGAVAVAGDGKQFLIER